MRREVSYEDIMANPHEYGIPSFAEFARNPAKWRARADEAFASIEKGSEMLGKVVRKHTYKFKKGTKEWTCKSLEEVQRVAENEGFPLQTLDFKGEMRQLGEGKYEIVVTIFPKLIVSP